MSSKGMYVTEFPLKTPYKWSKGFSTIYNNKLHYFGGIINDPKSYFVDVSSLDLSLMNIKESGGIAIVKDDSIEWTTEKTNILPFSFGYMYNRSILAETQVSTSINNLVYILNARSNAFPFGNHLVIFDLDTLQYKSNNTYSSNSYQLLTGTCVTNNISHIFGIGGIDPNQLFFSIQIYNILNNIWTLGDILNDEREGAGCAYLKTYPYIYIFGGESNETYFINSIEKYDTTIDECMYAGTLIHRRYYTKCIANDYDNKIYCIGGKGDESITNYDRGLNSIEQYDPLTEMSTIVGSLTDKKWDFMVNIYYHNDFAMLFVFGGTWIHYLSGEAHPHYFDSIEYSFFKNNTYKHSNDTRLIQWGLQNIFCFPLYWYPAFVLFSSVLFFLIILLLNCFKQTDINSEKSTKLIQKRKDSAVQAIVSSSSLPVDIANIIVSDYLYGIENNNLFIQLLNKKLSIKRNITAQFLLYYNIIGVILYLTTFGIIIYVHKDFKQQQNISYKECIARSLNKANCDKYTQWQSYQEWIMSILIMHPMIIPINYIHTLYIFMVSEAVTNQTKRMLTIMIIPYLLIVFSCIIPGFFTMLIPAAVIYLPSLIMFALVVNLCCFWIYFVKDNLFNALKDNPSIHIHAWLIFSCVFYMIIVIICAQMWCFFDGNDWFECFKWGLMSGYCPNITINWYDWKGVTLFLTWILF
eukprot:460597_1